MGYRNFPNKIKYLLYSPGKIFCLCFVFTTFSLVSNNSLGRLWGLHKDRQKLESEIEKVTTKINLIDLQLQKAKDPVFIERIAHDKLDLVGEEDLVFVF